MEPALVDDGRIKTGREALVIRHPNGGCHTPYGTLGNVEAHKNPDYLRAVARSVVEFRDAFQVFMKLHVFNDSLARGTAPAVFPRDDADADEIAGASAAVDEAAGRAAAAPGLTGVKFNVQGAGVIDPIAAWHTVTKPKPVLEPDDIVSACNQMTGRLDELIRKAEAEAPPQVGAESMHPLIWGAASRLWRDGHFRQAVAAAAETLITHVKSRTQRNDVAETALWQETFSDKAPELGKPRLRWPGEPTNRDVKSMNDGLRQFAPGAQMTIRNPAAHDTGEMPEQHALERLATLSLLARWVDECELIERHDP